MANPKSDGKGGVGFDGHRYHRGTHSHRKAKASTWMSKWPHRARGAAKANERERETRQYSSRAREEEEGEEETDRVVETEWSTSDRERATDDAWWLGSVNALSRECEMCRAQPPPTMSVANRFAVLAGDVDGDVQLSCQRFGSTNTAKHTGGIRRGTTMRSPEPGQRQKVSWNAADCAGRSAYHESGIWRPQRCVLFPRMHQQKDTRGGGCGGLRSGRKCSTTENIPS